MSPAKVVVLSLLTALVACLASGLAVRQMLTTEVPTVRLKTVDAAAALAEATELTLFVAAEEHSQLAEKGKVLDQAPRPGARAAIGSALIVSVSLGPKPAAAPPPPPEEPKEALVAVPPVLEVPVATARALLREAGLVPEEVAVDSADKPAGVVVRAEPPPGARTAPGTVVKLEVATAAKLVEIPRLTRKSVGAAKRALEKLGLKVGATKRRSSEDLPFDRVVTTEPGPGQKVPAGSEVTLFVNFEGDDFR
jgi:serine/threonine-protein kinase